jgi:hypothetical protein
MENREISRMPISLMEEIVRIKYRVAVLGPPASIAQRSLLARYGKVLFLSERLLRAALRGRTGAMVRGVTGNSPPLPLTTFPIKHINYRPRRGRCVPPASAGEVALSGTGSM